MKKLIVAVVAVGAVLALRPVVKRRMVEKMRNHCQQMMRQFAGRSEMPGEGTMSPEAMPRKMHEHCKQMAAQHEERREPVVTA